VIRSRPRKIRVLLSGTPQKQKLVPEGCASQGSAEVRDDHLRVSGWLESSRKVNLELALPVLFGASSDAKSLNGKRKKKSQKRKKLKRED
jgi:hypothetical protein